MYFYLRPKVDNVKSSALVKNRHTVPSLDESFGENENNFDKDDKTKGNILFPVRNHTEQSRFDEIRARISDIGKHTNDIKAQFQQVLKIAADMETKHNIVVKGQNDIIKLLDDLTM